MELENKIRKKSLSFPAMRVGDVPPLQHHLFTTFPKLYGKLAYDPYALYRVPIGWFGLVWEMSARLEASLHNIPEPLIQDYAMTQIKQKFGSLRVRFNQSTPEMDSIVDWAVAVCDRTCEQCGEHSLGEEHVIWPPLATAKTLWGYHQRVCPTHYRIFKEADR